MNIQIPNKLFLDKKVLYTSFKLLAGCVIEGFEIQTMPDKQPDYRYRLGMNVFVHSRPLGKWWHLSVEIVYARHMKHEHDWAFNLCKTYGFRFRPFMWPWFLSRFGQCSYKKTEKRLPNAA